MPIEILLRELTFKRVSSVLTVGAFYFCFRKNYREKAELFESYVLCSEAVSIYFLVFGGWLIKNRIGSNPTIEVEEGDTKKLIELTMLPKGGDLLLALRDNIYVWLPPVSSLAITSIGNLLGRWRENREVNRQQNARHDARLQAEMETHRGLGEDAMKKGQYHLALDHFHAAAEIYAHIYARDSRVRAKQLYLDCMYKKAMSMYCMKQNADALTLLSDVLVDPNYQGELHERALLFNLKGLILFHMGRLPENSGEDSFSVLWNDAKAAFEASFKIDSSQNSIYLFLQYLTKNHQFLVDNIPSALFSPRLNLSTNASGIMQNDTLILCADACVKQQYWAKAILLYENRLSDMRPDPSIFFDLALVNLDCFRAYKGLIDNTAGEEVALLSIKMEQVGGQGAPSKPSLVEESVSVTEVKALSAKKFLQAKACLDAELFYIVDSLKLAKAYINHALLYHELFNLVDGLEYGVELPSAESLNELSIARFQKAKDILNESLPNEVALLRKAEEGLRSLTTGITFS